MWGPSLKGPVKYKKNDFMVTNQHSCGKLVVENGWDEFTVVQRTSLPLVMRRAFVPCCQPMERDGPPSTSSKSMATRYRISLPSGAICTVPGDVVLDLKVPVHEQLQKPSLQLCTSDGCILDPRNTCDFFDELNQNAIITAIAKQPKTATTNCVFSVWCEGSPVWDG